MHAMLIELIEQNRKKMNPRGKLAKFVQGHATSDRRRKTLELARRDQDGKHDLTASIAVHTNLKAVPINITEDDPSSGSARTTGADDPNTRRRKKATGDEAEKHPARPPAQRGPDDDDDIDALLARNPDWTK